MSVKRFIAHHRDEAMHMRNHGDWVKYTEYETLEIEHKAAMLTISAIMEMLGVTDSSSISGQVAALLKERDALAVENAGLKEQNPKAWYIRMTDEVTTDAAEAQKWRGQPLVLANFETPHTYATLKNIQAHGVITFADKPGFSFQHDSIYAHFGNGDVMVGCVTHEDGSAGINFAPVREKLGGSGTDYEWTRGKTAQGVESVFVIASTSIESLEVIKGKLDDAIEVLRKESTHD